MRAHLNLNTCAANRLAYLRKYAANGKWVHPMTWREVRFAKFNSCADIDQGFNDGAPIWYVNPCKDGYFSREKFADEICNFRHTGYFTDTECHEKARGIVVSLPHGKFIAGYYWSSNDERVYYPEIYTDEDDAARAADSHAESFADAEREHSEKYDAARALESEIESLESEIDKGFAMRNHPRLADRDEVSDLIEKIREKRETLKTEYGDYV